VTKNQGSHYSVAVIANIAVIIVDNKLNAIIHEDKRLLRQALVLRIIETTEIQRGKRETK
jgi:hypothetical protein